METEEDENENEDWVRGFRVRGRRLRGLAPRAGRCEDVWMPDDCIEGTERKGNEWDGIWRLR
jgi:hypothetical protein